MKRLISPSVDRVDLTHYALTHGIVYGSKTSSTLVSPAPMTASPHAFPKKAFEKGIFISTIFNMLIDQIARRPQWLMKTLESTSKSDEFTGRLLDIMKIVQAESPKQFEVTLTINRSDYMLHEMPGDARTLLQVEINTISSSFGSLSSQLSGMYKLFAPRPTLEYVIPDNGALEGISDALALAHLKFKRDTKTDNPHIAFIVQPNERNIADQRLLHFKVYEKHGVVCKRYTLKDVHDRGSLNSNTGGLIIDGQTVSVAYFRAGYSPGDYPTEDEWSARLLIERSSAIKCPNIGTHLAGTKKVQQVLAKPGILESFICYEPNRNALRDVFAGLYSLDKTDSEGEDGVGGAESQLKEVIERAVKDPSRFVLKPQREGGGNNIYGQEMATALQTMSDEELAAFILMERICPPLQKAVLIRDENEPVEEDCVCELGIFGAFLSDGRMMSYEPAETATIEQAISAPDALDGVILVNKCIGHLLRVKPSRSDEGGVAAGYAVLSAPALF